MRQSQSDAVRRMRRTLPFPRSSLLRTGTVEGMRGQFLIHLVVVQLLLRWSLLFQVSITMVYVFSAVQFTTLHSGCVASAKRDLAEGATEAVHVKDQIPGAHHKFVAAQLDVTFRALASGEDSGKMSEGVS